MKLLAAALATLAYVALLVIVYVVHARFLPVNVVLYSAVADAVVATLIGAALLFGVRWFHALNTFEKGQLVVIWLLGGYAAALSVPTVIDRSLSLYILEKLAQRGGAIQLRRFEEVFAREYMKEHRLVDVRVTEQVESGTIVINDGCVRLTDRGKAIAKVSRAFRQNFLPARRLLMGEYTDDLTDPFRKSAPSADYGC